MKFKTGDKVRVVNIITCKHSNSIGYYKVQYDQIVVKGDIFTVKSVAESQHSGGYTCSYCPEGKISTEYLHLEEAPLNGVGICSMQFRIARQHKVKESHSGLRLPTKDELRRIITK